MSQLDRQPMIDIDTPPPEAGDPVSAAVSLLRVRSYDNRIEIELSDDDATSIDPENDDTDPQRTNEIAKVAMRAGILAAGVTSISSKSLEGQRSSSDEIEQIKMNSASTIGADYTDIRKEVASEEKHEEWQQQQQKQLVALSPPSSAATASLLELIRSKVTRDGDVNMENVVEEEKKSHERKLAASTSSSPPSLTSPPLLQRTLADSRGISSRYTVLMKGCPVNSVLHSLIASVAQPTREASQLLKRDPLHAAKLFHRVSEEPSSTVDAVPILTYSSKNFRLCANLIKKLAEAAPSFNTALADRPTLEEYLPCTVPSIDISSIQKKLESTRVDRLPKLNESCAYDSYKNGVRFVIQDLVVMVINFVKAHPPSSFIHTMAIKLAGQLLRIHLPALRKVIKVDEDLEVCIKCGSGSSEENDSFGLLMQCEGCGFWHHQGCANVCELPKESWYCNWCASRSNLQEQQLSENQSTQASSSSKTTSAKRKQIPVTTEEMNETTSKRTRLNQGNNDATSSTAIPQEPHTLRATYVSLLNRSNRRDKLLYLIIQQLNCMVAGSGTKLVDAMEEFLGKEEQREANANAANEKSSTTLANPNVRNGAAMQIDDEGGLPIVVTSSTTKAAPPIVAAAPSPSQTTFHWRQQMIAVHQKEVALNTEQSTSAAVVSANLVPPSLASDEEGFDYRLRAAFAIIYPRRAESQFESLFPVSMNHSRPRHRVYFYYHNILLLINHPTQQLRSLSSLRLEKLHIHRFVSRFWDCQFIRWPLLDDEKIGWFKQLIAHLDQQTFEGGSWRQKIIAASVEPFFAQGETLSYVVTSQPNLNSKPLSMSTITDASAATSLSSVPPVLLPTCAAHAITFATSLGLDTATLDIHLRGALTCLYRLRHDVKVKNIFPTRLDVGASSRKHFYFYYRNILALLKSPSEPVKSCQQLHFGRSHCKKQFEKILQTSNFSDESTPDSEQWIAWLKHLVEHLDQHVPSWRQQILEASGVPLAALPAAMPSPAAPHDSTSPAPLRTLDAISAPLDHGNESMNQDSAMFLLDINATTGDMINTTLDLNDLPPPYESISNQSLEGEDENQNEPVEADDSEEDEMNESKEDHGGVCCLCGKEYTKERDTRPYPPRTNATQRAHQTCIQRARSKRNKAAASR